MCSNVQRTKDSGLIAESLMPPLRPLTGQECVLPVTKVPTPVQLVLDPLSPTVPAAKTAGSKMVQTAVSLVTPSVPPAMVPDPTHVRHVNSQT